MKYSTVIEIPEDVAELLNKYYKSIEGLRDGIFTQEDCIVEILREMLLSKNSNVFYVIEYFHGDNPSFVTDEEGYTKVFNSYKEALEEARDCQDGEVIAI